MITTDTKIRVRYDEVDKMGYVYHGNYAKYFHISRSELLRVIGICDKALESQNIILPVIEMSVKYLKPIYYDDEIIIQTTLAGIPTSRMEFNHKVYNQKHEIVNKANSVLVFVDANSRKPMRAPIIIQEKIKSYIQTLN